MWKQLRNKLYWPADLCMSLRLNFHLPPTDRSGPGRLFWRWIGGLAGRRPEHYASGMELATEHKKREGRTWLGGYLFYYLLNGFPNHHFIQPPATPSVFDIVIMRHLPSLAHMTSCSALRSDHLPVLIDTTCRLFFHHTYCLGQIPLTRDCIMIRPFTRVLRNSLAPFWKFWKPPISSIALVRTTGLRYRQAFRMKYA
jgi:hypothetical protein